MLEKKKKHTKNVGNFKHDPARAAAAGRKGGAVSPGNFKNDPERARAAGRKGGRPRKNGKPGE